MRAKTLSRIGKLRRFPACLALAGLVVLALVPFLSDRAAHAAVPPQYFKIERLVLPVIRRRGLEGHLFLVIYLELNDIRDRPFVASKRTPLRDEYIRTLNRYIARRPRILYKVSLPELKVVLMKASARIVGEGKIKAVLIQAAANRRF
jgi:hypothetical protein